MINREDLVFATCYQLAQLISEDWEIPPSEVTLAINALKPVDEPGEVFWGSPPVVNPLSLAGSETEPKTYRDSYVLIQLKLASQLFRIIMEHSDGWQTQDSDTIKKEIVSRIANYESQIKDITAPVSNESCVII